MKTPKNFLRRQPQQKRSQQKVEKILDAAAEVFDEKGFETATTHDIARKANTAIGSLYQFFPDKKAIFNALELRHIDRVYLVWEKLFQPEVIKLPLKSFIGKINREFQELFRHASSRVLFVQYFTSNTMFKNIDDSFTEESIQVMSQLLQLRNPKLDIDQSNLLAEISVHTINTLLLLALRSQKNHRQEVFQEIETFMISYLSPHIGDDVLLSFPKQIVVDKLTQKYHLNSRQSLALKEVLKQGFLTIKMYAQLCGDVSKRTLQRDLKKMVEQDLLIQQGKTNQLTYSLSPTINFQSHDNL